MSTRFRNDRMCFLECTQTINPYCNAMMEKQSAIISGSNFIFYLEKSIHYGLIFKYIVFPLKKYFEYSFEKSGQPNSTRNVTKHNPNLKQLNSTRPDPNRGSSKIRLPDPMQEEYASRSVSGCLLECTQTSDYLQKESWINSGIQFYPTPT